jgi:hypothetical protein
LQRWQQGNASSRKEKCTVDVSTTSEKVQKGKQTPFEKRHREEESINCVKETRGVGLNFGLLALQIRIFSRISRQ